MFSHLFKVTFFFYSYFKFSDRYGALSAQPASVKHEEMDSHSGSTQTVDF